MARAASPAASPAAEAGDEPEEEEEDAATPAPSIEVLDNLIEARSPTASAALPVAPSPSAPRPPRHALRPSLHSPPDPKPCPSAQAFRQRRPDDWRKARALRRAPAAAAAAALCGLKTQPARC